MTNTPPSLVPTDGKPEIFEKAAPLGGHARSGAFWALGQTVASKLLGIVAQFLLGYLLDGQSFGLAATAFTLYGFTAVTQRFGLTEVLVQRHDKFRQWVNPAFWMSLASGLFSLILVVAVAVGARYFYQARDSAVVAGEHYQSRDLLWLLIIIGMTLPFDALCTCPTARLQAELRFRTLNVINFIANVALAGLTIVFALAHFGPYAIILPRPIVALLQAGILWYVAPVPVLRNAELPLWRGMLDDGAAITMSNYAANTVQQGDNLTLSLFHPMAVVGVYWFAYNMSTQTGQLVAANLTSTFFSILAKLKNEVERQAEAYLKVSKVVALILVPLCLLQAMLAEPALHFLWGRKWEAAIPVLEVLSVGACFSGNVGLTVALFQAQGRFRFRFRWQLFSAALFLTCVLIGALSGGALAVAFSVTLYAMVVYPAGAYLALRPARISLMRTLNIYLPPFLYGVLACVVTYLVVEGAIFIEPLMPQRMESVVLPLRILFLLKGVAVAGLMLPLYALLLFYFCPSESAMMHLYMQPVLARLGFRKRQNQLDGVT